MSDGVPVTVPEIDGGHGRVHVLDFTGHLVIDYTATVTGQRDNGGESDLLEYRRPSRRPSDKLLATAARKFGDIGDDAFVAAVTAWVHDRLIYTSGSSGPTDDAVDTLLLGEASAATTHTSCCRCCGLATCLPGSAVYAPGLDPMDFHAVVEAWVGGAAGRRHRPAPRESMLLRIATGRDAADTAFMSTHCGTLTLTEMMVTATVDDLPTDDPATVVELR